ncbi:MAG: NCS2 family permease [Phycisphaerales bacterium]|nr:MAG: NCS2 family permease [Phycisphaerales bacterium]
MLDRYFGLGEKHTSVRIEFVAGATTFLTMAYIIFVHPDILSTTGMDKEALIAVTCIISALATVATGVFGRAPIAMAPGMGLNAYFAFTLVGSGKVTWQTGLGVVFLSGLFFLILTLVGLRKKLVEAIPAGLISAISVGIGLFIAFIGLGNLGLVLRDEQTLFSLGAMSWTVAIGLLALAVMIVLELLKVTGSLLIGIALATIAAAVFGYVDKPDSLVSLDWRLGEIAFGLDIVGALRWSLFGSIFTLMFIDMFDSIGTLVACCDKADMRDKNNQIRGLDRLLGIDAVATMVGALVGTSTTTSYVESAAGIEEGGRTGLTSVFAGVMFLLALFFVPVIAIVPSYATAPAQIMVGLFMIKEIRKIRFSKVDEAIPALIIVIMIAVSYQISTGLALGFVSFAVIKAVSGRFRQVKPAMWIIAALSLLFLVIDWLPRVIDWSRRFV